MLPDDMTLGDAVMILRNISLPINDKKKLKAIEIVLESQESNLPSRCYCLRMPELYRVVRYLLNLVKKKGKDHA